MAEDLLTSDPGSLFNRLQERYGLGQDPLAMDFPFFAGAQRQYALETIRHLAAFGDMALLVTGGRGSGKTRLLAELVRAESERLKFHRLTVADITTEQSLADALLRIAHHGLGAGRSSRDAIFGFFKWSETATRKGQRIVLLLDDADHMPAAVVRVLLAAHRAADCSQCAVPVLTGADGLVSALGIAEANDSVQQRIHQVHLRPLTQKELSEYLAPRIEKAGGSPATLLSNARLKRLHELSQGSFARLKRTAPAVWLDIAGHQPSPSSKPEGPGLKKLMWPALAILLLGGSWLVVSRQYESMVAPEPEVVAKPEPERKTVRLGPDAEIWTDVPLPEEKAADQSDLAENKPAEQYSVAPTERAPLPAEEPDSPEPSNVMKQSAPAEDDLAEADRDASEPSSETAAEVVTGNGEETLPPETAPGNGVGQSADQDGVADEDSIAEEQQAPEAPQPAPESGQTEPQAPGSTESNDKPAYDVANPERFRPVEQLRQREGYTAQYIAGYEEDTALDFLAEHPGLEELVYTRSTRKGKPWYVVIYGGFASREEADQAVSQLPQGLAQRDVWIRSFSGL